MSEATPPQFDIAAESARYFDDSSIPHGEEPRLVVILGAPATGKSTLRRQKFASGYVLVDAGDIFIHLSGDEYQRFPSTLRGPMEEIGALVARRAIAERRHIVTELSADVFDALEKLFEPMRALGYSVSTEMVTCDSEEAARRNRSRTSKTISSFYAGAFQLRWLVEAANAVLPFSPLALASDPKAREKSSRESGDTDRSDLTTLTQLAEELANSDRLRQAAAVARTVTALAPDDPATWFFLAAVLLALGGSDEVDEAETCLQNALHLDGSRLEYCRSMAQLRLQRGEMKQAATWCEQGIVLAPDSPFLQRTLARARALSGDLDGACESLERCLALDPDAPDHSNLRAELGNLYLRKNDYPAAIEHLRAALEADPSAAAPLWRNIGHALSRQGEQWEAVKAFRKAVELDPRDAGHHYNLGDAYLTLEEPRMAVGALLQAVALAPDYLLAQYDLGRAFFELGKFEDGAAASRAALKDDPEMKYQSSNLGIGATGNLGLCLTNLGRPEEAVECYQRSLQLFAPTFFNLGLAQFKLRRFEEALENFQLAAKIHPNDAEYFDLVGNALSELGRKTEAMAALERSLEVDPRYALAHYDLGTVLQTGSAEEVERALKCFETAIALDPDLFWAYYAAGCIHARAGRTAEALHLIEQALEKGLEDFDHIGKDSDLDSLRQDSRFLELLGRFRRG